MADSQLGWSDAQWEKVNNAVTESFAKASVAGAFLPCYGPLTDSAEYVRDETFTATGATVGIADDTTVKLFNLTVAVQLSSEQVAEESLASALLAFRRAANTLAQVEDDLVFNGIGKPRKHVETFLNAPVPFAGSSNFFTNQGIVRPSSPPDMRGLVHTRTERGLDGSAGQIVESKIGFTYATAMAAPFKRFGGPAPTAGEHLVEEVANAVVELESLPTPVPSPACWGRRFVAARPNDGLVLPADRIAPLLNGHWSDRPHGVGSGIVVPRRPMRSICRRDSAEFNFSCWTRTRYSFRVREIHTRIKDQPLCAVSVSVHTSRRSLSQFITVKHLLGPRPRLPPGSRSGSRPAPAPAAARLRRLRPGSGPAAALAPAPAPAPAAGPSPSSPPYPSDRNPEAARNREPPSRDQRLSVMSHAPEGIVLGGARLSAATS